VRILNEFSDKSNGNLAKLVLYYQKALSKVIIVPILEVLPEFF
jgi:hypothetical protein